MGRRVYKDAVLQVYPQLAVNTTDRNEIFIDSVKWTALDSHYNIRRPPHYTDR
ncbi:hypothetical protein J6590_088700, partial [Homalodisca vitripennis]